MEQTMVILMTFSRVLENPFFPIDALFPSIRLSTLAQLGIPTYAIHIPALSRGYRPRSVRGPGIGVGYVFCVVHTPPGIRHRGGRVWMSWWHWRYVVASRLVSDFWFIRSYTII